MAKRDDVFPSKYLKAGDLKGAPITVTIVSAPAETLKTPDGREETKTVLYFRGAKKNLPLNRTNWDTVASICGDDSDDWPGHRIELYPTTTEMKGKVVDCIRVRAPVQGELTPKKKPPPPAADGDIDDSIPF